MSVVQGQDYYWAFTGDGTLDYPWLYLQANDGSYVNHHWTINSLLYGGWTSIGYVDMGLNSNELLARDEDWLTLSNSITNTGNFRLNLKGVDYVDAPLDKNISLEVVSKEGFTTDGSLISLSMNVGNHTLNYWDAARDSTLFQGSGWDTVHLDDNPDIPGIQYWSLIRRIDGQIDAYSLFSGYRIRIEGGTVTWNNNNNTMNYGEVEKFFMRNARSGSIETPEPGNVIPTANAKYLDVNIDLRSYEGVGTPANTAFSDSFNLAWFNYIRYTSDNIWTGEATIYDAVRGRYSPVSNTQVAGATSLPVVGTNRNGTHDLIVGQQANYYDGQLRLYAFNVASGSYNTFNDVYLGNSADNGKDYSATNLATAVDRVAMYGFDGNDILTGGRGNDYIFGGQGDYNQLLDITHRGNQITGGAGADFFGVGNTNTSGTVTGSNSGAGYNSGQALMGYATDVITDWDAVNDTLYVLSNGVAVISGLSSYNFGTNIYSTESLTASNVIDLRDHASIVTVNEDFDNARGGSDGWDNTRTLQQVYDNQTTRDAQSIKNEGSDISVVNNGLIVARGMESNDTLYGSAGNDYLYGNQGQNLINLSEGGVDRVFEDTRAGRQYVSDFSGVSGDKVYLAKNIVDAFGGNANRNLAIYDTVAQGKNYTSGSAYSQGIDFLYGVTYKAYLSNSYGASPYTNDESWSMDLSADITTYVSGIISIGVGIGLCFIPFVGPALGAPFIAAGVLLEAGKIYSDVGNTSLGSVPHINPVYDLTTSGASFTSNYVYVLDNPYTPSTSAATGSTLGQNDNVKFLDFFPQARKYDGFADALELNPGYGGVGDSYDGIYGYFVVYSTTETFVYLITSDDHLIEDHEAFKVAEVAGHLSASDFVVYDSNYDPYNKGADQAVILKKPTITYVTENSGPTYTANVPAFAYTASPYLKVTGTIDSVSASPATTTVTQVNLYDSNSPSDGVVGTSYFSNGTTSFVINDTRRLGQLIIQTDYNTSTGVLNSLELDNTFEYQDRRVIYYATIYNDVDGNGEMVIESRSNTFTVIDNGPSNATVNGGNGSDTLLLESTSSHLNNATDAQIVNIETISVKPPMGPGLSVSVSGGAVTGVSIMDGGAKVMDGTYDLTISDDSTGSESGATGWKVVVSGGRATSVVSGNGGSGYTSSSYANANWTPVGVTMDLHAQTEGFTVNGYDGSDSIIGAQGGDRINAMGGNDTVDGGSGNDTIEGGAGTDKLTGGSGGDVFVVTSMPDFVAGETITGGTNTGTVDRLQLSQATVSGSAVSGTYPSITVSTAGLTTTPITGTYDSTKLSASVTGVEVIELTLNAAYSLTLANAMYVGVDADGNDTIDNTITIQPTVNNTNDMTIVGGATNDTYELVVLDNGYLDGNDSITGGAGGDTLNSGDGNDTVTGGAVNLSYSGADSIATGNGNDLIVQTLYQTVADTIVGGDDTDKLTVTRSNALTDLDNVTQVETIELLSGLGANYSYTISNASAFDNDSTGVIIDGDALTSTEALVFSATNLNRGITILGGAGNDSIIDGAGNDSIVTNDGNDKITLSGAGTNTVSSGNGTDSIILGAGTDWVTAGNDNDTVIGGANVTVADTLDGGAQIDLLTISNDNNTDDLNNVVRFENIQLAAGQSYHYIIGDGSLFDQDTVAVTVDATNLGAGDSINFDASNLDRSITILFGAGDDTIYGGHGTSDSINAGNGNDLIIMGNQLTGSDSIDGGNGNDTLTFSDNGTGTNDLDHVINIENITLGDSITSVITVDTLVAAGQTLKINASALTGSNTLNWNGAAENDGHFSVTGSSQNDTITGGAGNDTLQGGAGVDSLSGGNGNDLFAYASSVVDQTGTGETVTGGNGTDIIVVSGGTNLVDFSNDVISGIETLEMTLNAAGGSDNNDQTVKMTDAQVDALATIKANDGATSGSSDRIIITDTMTSDMLSNVASGGGITVVNGILNIELTEQSGPTAQALTLVEGNLTSSSDLLKVDASTLTGDDTLAFDASAETTARVSVTGGNSNDLIIGSNVTSQIDTLSGGNGNDTIEGKAGADALYGNEGDDTLVYDSAAADATDSGETIDGGNGTDRILVFGNASNSVNFSNDTITSIETLELSVNLAGATDSNNQLVTMTNNQVDGLSTINANGDTLTVSNTLLSGALDGTTINGTLVLKLTDQSTTTVVAQALTLVDGTLDNGAGDVLRLDASALTSDTLNFNGSAEDDSKVSVTGGAGNDTIVGTNSSLIDTLSGGLGNDILIGGAGNDQLSGGNGNDIFAYNSATDESAVGEVIDGGNQTDTIVVAGNAADTIDFSNDTISNIETLEMTLDSVGTADGTDQTVKMTNAQIDSLSTIKSNAGSSSPTVSDILIVTDTMLSNMLDGTRVNGTLTLQLTDQNGATVTGQALTLVDATLGAGDLLKVDASGFNSDTLNLNGSAENDASVSVTGGLGADTITGTESSVGDTLIGGIGNDSLMGGAGHDSVTGGGGNDTIVMSIASSSIDTLDAGAQTDWLVINGTAPGTVLMNLDAGANADQLTQINGVNENINQSNFENVDASALAGAGLNATAISSGSEIIGSAQNDTLTGGIGNDTFTGGAGSDSMTGGNGDDLFKVGGTDVNGDTLQGGNGSDTLQFTADTDLTQAGSFGGVETLLLDQGVDLILSTSQLADVDAIVGTGNNGGETISVLASNGNDVVDLSASSFTLDTNDVSMLVDLGAGNDSVTMTAGADSVYGGDGNDTIIGGAGADTINGGNGTDTASYADITSSTSQGLADVAGVAINLSAAAVTQSTMASNMSTALGVNVKYGNASTDLAVNTVAYLIPTGGTTSVTYYRDTLISIENATGTSLDDYIVGSTGDNVLSGGDGKDYILGNGGNDTLLGGIGNDYLMGSTGNDSLEGSAGNDQLDGYWGQNTLNGGDGNDTLNSRGTDVVDAGNDADTIYVTDPTVLTVDGGSGTDRLYVNFIANFDDASDGQFQNIERYDILNGISVSFNQQTEDLVVYTSNNATTVNGGEGNDSVTAGSGDDSLVGGNGNDTLLGAAGNDTFFGGLGDDSITGGAGNDQIQAGNGNDIIVVAGTADVASGESYDGSYGADTLKVTADTDFANLTSMSSVETLLLSDTVQVTIAASFLTDVTAINGTGDLGGEAVTVLGTGGNDSLDLSAITVDTNDISGLYVIADAGNDTLSGGNGRDSLMGGDGNDRITTSVVSGSIDRLDGGNQTDWMVLTGAAAGTVVINLNAGSGNDQMTSINGSAESVVQSNFENLDASVVTGAGINATAISTGSYIIGSGQGDTITGGAGNDTIEGGAGADSMTGGNGNDLLVINGTADVATGETYDGGFGADTLKITADTNFANLTSMSSIETLLLSNTVNVTIAGSLLADVTAINGTDNNNLEAVTVLGTSGADALDLSTITLDTNDIAGLYVITGLGNDTITGTNGHDTILGGNGNDRIVTSMAASSIDNLDAGNQTDTIVLVGAAAGTVVVNLDAGAGIDQITSINGSSESVVQTNFENLDASGLTGAGVNAAALASGSTMIGSGQADTLNGGNGDDVLQGGGGADSISGGIGADTITGGAGADLLSGGDGNDIFVFNATTDTDSVGTVSNMDTITGAAYNDVFDLTSFASYDAGSFSIDAFVSGSADDYVATWTTNGGATTYSVLLKSTGNTAGFATSESTGVVTLTEAVVVAPSEAAPLLSGNSTLSYVSPNYASNSSAVTNTATQFQDGNPNTRITLSMGAIDAFLGWHKALGFSKQSDFTNTVLLTTTTANSGTPDLVVIDDSLNSSLVGGSTGYTLADLANPTKVDLILDNSITWSAGSNNSGLAVTTNGVNTYIFADVHYDRSAENLGTVPMVDSTLYQRPLTGAKDSQLILTIAGLNDTTLISVADFIVSGEIILGSSGADSKTGTEGDDGMHGGGGSDTLSGGNGNDYLTGDADTAGNSADWFLITAGSDTILDLSSGGVADHVQVSAGASVSATLYGNWTATSSTSNAGSGTVDARGKTMDLTNVTGPNGWYLKDTSTSATTFTGSGFDDTIQGGEGADTIIGGNGSDTASYASSSAGVTVNLTVTGAQTSTGDASGDKLSNIENLLGSAYADTLTGDANANQIWGGAGNDTLIGGAGDDLISGGDGNDVLTFNDVELTASDTIDGGNGSVDILSITGSGSATNDTNLQGVEFVEWTDSSAADLVSFVGQSESITFTFANADINDAGPDTILLGSGNDTILGGENMELWSASCYQTLNGGLGTDELRFANSWNDPFDDSLISIEKITLTATANVNLDQQTEAFTIVGSSGADTITAGAGADTITGGSGADSITGGVGADVFVYSSATDGRDTYSDFSHSTDKYDTDWATSRGNYSVGDVGSAVSWTAWTVNLNTTVVSGLGVYRFTNLGAIDFTDSQAVIDAISDGNIYVSNSGDNFLLILTNGTNSYLYQVDDGGAGSIGAKIEAAEVALVGIFQNTSTFGSGDII